MKRLASHARRWTWTLHVHTARLHPMHLGPRWVHGGYQHALTWEMPKHLRSSSETAGLVQLADCVLCAATECLEALYFSLFQFAELLQAGRPL